MKLWIKLSILLIVAIYSTIQLIFFFVLPNIKQNSLDLIGEKLKSVAVAASFMIDGDEYSKLDFDDPKIQQNQHYVLFRNNLIQLKESLDIQEELYTLNYLNDSTAQFGVMTNSKIFSGKLHQLTNPIARNYFLKTFNKDVCIYTPLYNDQYGEWVTGLAPIKNSYGKIVGVIQVDHTAKTVSAKIADIEDFLLQLELLIIPFVIIIGLITSKLFYKPVEKIEKVIKKIADGDYSENETIKASGAIRSLASSAENLRMTILEQQEKIFNTISELEKAKTKAENSDKLKSEFLAVLSHEIRTPLNVILGNLGIVKLELEDGNYSEINNIICSVENGSIRLIRTVEMIVLYSELVTENYSPNNSVIDIATHSFPIIRKYEIEAEKKGIEFSNNIKNFSGFINIDPNLFNEIVSQLLDNAVKYTHNGGVQLKIINENENFILSIKDTGIGISQSYLSQLFKPFTQEDMSYTRPFEGNGIGLALVKKICDINNLQIIINSKKNEGTEVLVSFPKIKILVSQSETLIKS